MRRDVYFGRKFIEVHVNCLQSVNEVEHSHDIEQKSSFFRVHDAHARMSRCNGNQPLCGTESRDKKIQYTIFAGKDVVIHSRHYL